MTGKQKMGIVAAILVALLAANWALSAWNDRQETREAKEAEAEKIYLTDAEDVTAYSYSDGKNEMSFSRTDDVWYYDADSEIPMSQSTIQSTADDFGKMEAVRKLEDPDELSDYGLEDPLYTIGFTDGDGNETSVYIGSGAGENYYATVDDIGDVYTVSADVINLLQFDLASLVQYDTVPSIGSGNLTKVTVTEDGAETVYEDDDDLAELAGGFGTLTLTSCADYHVTEEELAGYGLDEAQRITVTAEYTDNDSGDIKSYTVYVGAAADAGENRYVMAEGSKMVCEVSDAIVQNMIAVDEEE